MLTNKHLDGYRYAELANLLLRTYTNLVAFLTHLHVTDFFSALIIVSCIYTLFFR